MGNIVKSRVAGILKNHFLIQDSRLRGYRYLEDLGLTKPEKKELLNLFEDEFDIKLSEKDELKIRTVGDTVSVLRNYLHNDSVVKKQ
jgi:acyl carrier protein